MDLLSDVLRDLRLESAVLTVAELRSPWGITKRVVGAAPFYVIVEGRCLVEVDGGAVIELTQGDMVVIPHGHRHTLLSDRRASRTPFKDVLEANGFDGTWRPGMPTELHQIRFGGRGIVTRVITGVFAFVIGAATHCSKRCPR